MGNFEILKIFELNIQKRIIEFCNKINDSSADLYILMARKAACFVNALEKASLLNINSRVISERVLDCEIDWSSIKSVIIIDDVVISGTTLHQTIKHIKGNNPLIEIKVIVIGTNSKWFNSSLLQDEKGKSYIVNPVKSLSNQECIRLSGDIVRMLALIPRPYNIDYPIYNTFRLDDSSYSQMLNLPGWEVAEASSLVQDNKNIFTYSFIPHSEVLFNSGTFFKSQLIQEALLKIRIYGRTTLGKKKGVHSVTIVPMAILPPLRTNEIEELFKVLSAQHSKHLSPCLTTFTSKLRYIQYAIADQLANVFIKEYDYFTQKKTIIIRENETMRLLFPEIIIPDIIAAADNNLFDFNFKYIRVPNQQNKYKLKPLYSQADFVGINNTLNSLFIDMYYKAEIPARRLAYEYGAQIFNMPEYVSIINRLNHGYSLNDLENLLTNYSKDISKRLVSVFLDKAVDNGIAVPITMVEGNLIYRAFRHGEDVQFGQREERLCMEMFNAFNDEISKKTWQKLWVEKMMVLFLKIGEANFLEPIQTDISGYSSIASVRYYLQGPVVVRNSGQSFSDNPCLEYADKAKWLSRDLLRSNDFPLFLNEKGLYIFDENVFNERNYTEHDQEIIIEPGLINSATEIGEVLGKLVNNSILKKTPCLNTDDLISLSCCMTPRDIIGALAAEINIAIKTFKNNSFNQVSIEKLCKDIESSSEIESTKIKQIRSGEFFQSINDGVRKFGWFKSKNPYKIIERVKSQYTKRRDIIQWESLWSPNSGWDAPNETSTKVLNFIDLEGLWLLCSKAYFLILEYHFHYLNDDNHSMSKVLSQIEDIEDMLFPYFPNTKILSQIMPFISDFKKQRNEIDYNHKIFDLVMTKLNALITRAFSIVEDANEYFKSYNRRPDIRYYQTALYICIEDSKFEQEVFNIFVSILFKMTNSADAVKAELKEMSRDFSPLSNSNGKWYTGIGAEAEKWLLQFVDELMTRLNGKTNYKIIYFPALPDSCKIKHIDGNRFACNNFMNVIDQLHDWIISISFQNNVFYEIKDNSVDKTRQADNKKNNYAKITENSEFELYIPNLTKFTKTKYTKKMNSDIKKHVNIGILTIVTEESQAVLQSFTNIKTTHYANRYFDEFDYKTSAGNSIVGVHLQSADQGNTSIINALNSLRTHYTCDYIVLLGIAGSLKDNIKLCDVYIGTSVIYYDRRKEKPDGSIEHRGVVFNNSFSLTQHLNRFFVLHSEPAIMTRKNEDGTNKEFKVFRGPIGSGEAVIGNHLSPIKTWLQSVNSKVGVVETEAAGFFQAYYEIGNDLVAQDGINSEIIAIRGISDHANQNKDDRFRMEASLNAVHTLKELMELLFPVEKTL